MTTWTPSDWKPLINLKQSKHITEWYLVIASNMHKVDDTGWHPLFSLNVMIGPDRHTMILSDELRAGSFEESHETLDIWHDIISTNLFDKDEFYLKSVEINVEGSCCATGQSFDEFKNSFERYYCAESL